MNLAPWVGRWRIDETRYDEKKGRVCIPGKGRKLASDSTVEFRLHRASADPAVLVPWVCLLTRIVDYVASATDRDVARLPASGMRTLARIAPDLAPYYVNVAPDKRLALALALGAGVDTRAGHAAGYVAVHGKAVRYARKVGTWSTTKKGAGASARFVRGAAGDLAIIHGRYATCGDANSLLQAHPFAVQRNGRTALWGAHNGMIEGAHESAAAHGRTCDVDSREAFELLADGNVKDLAQLPGYGTLAWLDGTLRDRVR